MNSTYTPQSAQLIAKEQLNSNTFMHTYNLSVGASPGQFVNIWLPNLDEKPFSVASDNGDKMTFAIAGVGDFSKALNRLQIGQRIGIRGPYGKTYSIVDHKKVVLVGGGFGSAPLHFTGLAHQKHGSDVSIIIGARTKELLMYTEICEASGFRVFTTTNDGSSGEQGFVTLPLERLLQTENVDLVQCCGPELMMKAVAELCQIHDVACELSLERYMKCGFGVCGQCACDTTLACKDGTIISGEQALQLADFGKFHRDAVGKKIYY
jgi:dihydroorotate dehydrogenase electron transfer subunit